MIANQIARPVNARQWVVLASPIFVLVVCHLAAQLFTAVLGQWAWVGSFLVYWSSLLLIIWTLGDRSKLKARFGPSQGSRWWIVVAVGMGLISFPLLFFPNIGVMKSTPLVLAWFIFAVVNGATEELYWRGFLLDETSYLPRWLAVGYTSLVFVSIHPLVLGVFSKIQSFDLANPLRLLPFIGILIMLSLVFCLMYLKTKSLRLPILMHFLSDLGNLSIFLFMNMVSM